VAGVVAAGALTALAAGTASAAGCGATARFASSTNTVYLTGPGTCTLSDLAALGVKPAQLKQTDAANKVWYLTANLRIEQGAELDLHGGTDGDVNELRLRSDPGALTDNPKKFVWVRAEYGTVDLKSTKVTSWDATLNRADLNVDDGRAFIHVRSFLDSTGTPRESTMNIADSDVGYLGYNAAESYGLVWKVFSPGGGAVPFDKVNVLGDVTGSALHNNWFGAYTYGAYAMNWTGNEFRSNLKYGLDPHDDSDSLVIKDNKAIGNGDHGIICSQRCDHLTIEGNTAQGNTGHGIMIHRGVTDSVVKGNTATGNTDTGIAVFESSGNTVADNVVTGNLRGIRLSVGSSDNTFSGNTVSGNKSYGFYFYKGSDAPTPPGDGRNRRNAFTGNKVVDNGSYAVYATDSDDNVFSGNIWTGNKNGLYFNSGSGNKVDGIPDGLTVETYGAAGVPAGTTVTGLGAKAVIKLNSYATVSLSDSAGRVFDQDTKKLATTVGTGASSLGLTSATAGTSLTVYKRDLIARTGGGSATVDPTAWTTGTSPAIDFAVKAGSSSQQLTFSIGGLTSGKRYTVSRSGMTTRTLTASSGSIGFTDTPGTTAGVTYKVRAI
jgi:parallel beta-helix repeat protein